MTAENKYDIVNQYLLVVDQNKEISFRVLQK